ncbi:MAG: DUF1045 domain-containing protein [Burkholderiales bacterium]|nr:DUF1045 domain-containing protein [Burkholderiales bacterium]
MEARYAVYYAPPAHSDLWRLGCHWLGRDPERDEALEQPPVPGRARSRIEALTASPRAYGFHATLKPPFRLRAEARTADLHEALRILARSQRAFALPPLRVARLGGFLALTPAVDSERLGQFADAWVTGLDALRCPPEEDELRRRRAAGLTARQDALLSRWGYPYVFDEFRFHLTLTERLGTDEGVALQDWLTAWFTPALSQTLSVEEVSLYVQGSPGQAFRLMRRYPLGICTVPDSTPPSSM